jgi:hypothetical protein
MDKSKEAPFMPDIFVEHMVVRRPTSKIMLQKMLLSVAALIVGMLPYFITVLLGADEEGMPLLDLSMLIPVFLVGAGWGMIVLFRRLNLEFEYIVTNGEMDVDKIMGRRSRKRMFTVDCRNFDILAPVKPEYRNEYESRSITSKIDVSGHADAPGRWFAVYNSKDGARTLLIFEPNEKMLEAFKRYIRSKIKE